jgi:flagellar L-ring protein precursor FlgH
MKQILLPLLLSMLVFSATAHANLGRLYRLDSSPWSEKVANRPGDLLTVLISESSATSDAATRNTKKEDTKAWELTDIFLPRLDINEGFFGTKGGGDSPIMGLESSDETKGTATNNSSHEYVAQFQVRIVEKVGNGQFVIRGERSVNLNGKKKTMYLSGVIREEDIQTDPNDENNLNSVQSHLIADANIEIEGDVYNKDLEPGYISKFVSMILF